MLLCEKKRYLLEKAGKTIKNSIIHNKLTKIKKV